MSRWCNCAFLFPALELWHTHSKHETLWCLRSSSQTKPAADKR